MCPESILHIRTFRRWYNTQSGFGSIVQANHESIQWQEMFPGYCCLASLTRFPGTISWPIPFGIWYSFCYLSCLHVSQGGVDDAGAASVRAIMHWQYRTISRGVNSILHNLYSVLGPKAHDYISFYGLRSHGKLFDGSQVVTSQVSLNKISGLT